MKSTYIGKDQNCQNEYTVYWFRLDGVDNGTGLAFDSDVYGVCESGLDRYAADCDNCPIAASDRTSIAVLRNCTITDEMRGE